MGNSFWVKSNFRLYKITTLTLIRSIVRGEILGFHEAQLFVRLTLEVESLSPRWKLH